MSLKRYAKTAVITRTKDRPLLLRRAVESVLAQTDEDFIHVIVNDGGDKRPVGSLLENYKKSYKNRLLVIHNDASKGMEAASNIGINSSDSLYVVIHDDDDSWHPTFLERMIQRLENGYKFENIGGVICYATEITEQLSDTEVKEISRRSIAAWVKEVSLWRMCAGNFFPPISFLYKREVYKKIGGAYREDFPVQGDWEFNLRFMQHYEIVLLKEHLAFYYLRKNSNGSAEIYSNSVKSMDKHHFYQTYLRNEYLRKDIAQGQFGVGYMLNVNPIIIKIERLADGLLKIWGKLKYPFKRLKSILT